jgi:TolB protein
MKTSAVCIFFCLIFGALAAGPQRKIAFVRSDNIWVANIDGTAPRKIAVGSAPNLSFDGTRIAFDSAPVSAYEHVAKGGDDPQTHIAILDIASGNVTILKDVPSERCFEPFWSPDGKWIAFQSRRGSPLWVCDLAMINEDGTGFNVIKQGTKQFVITFYSPCWARDGRSIFCHDLTNICQLGLDGTVLAQWKIDQIIPSASMTGDDSIDVSPDGNRLLLGVNMGDEEHLKDWDGPPPALWSFDLTTQTAVRVTPKKLLAYQGCWLDNDNVLFLSAPLDAKGGGPVYRMSTNGKNLKPFLKALIRSGHVPSLSAP